MAVASGKGGVGTTTAAVNLAVALAQLGRRVVLVDADFDGADVGTSVQHSSRSTRSPTCSRARAACTKSCAADPAGIQVLPGVWSGESRDDCTPKAQERLIASLRALGPHADDVVLDVGQRRGTRRIAASGTRPTRCWW